MKNEKIEVRVTNKEKEVILKVADDFGWTTSKLFKEMMFTFISNQYNEKEALEMLKVFL